MPIVNADVKGLEVVVAAELSGDLVLCKEILDKEDIHGNNQKAFKLPSRLIAKVFKFRLIYGGSAYSYANDPDFTDVSTSQKYWQKVIDAYYEKYNGVKKWHEQIIHKAKIDGGLSIPSGRYFPFQPLTIRGEPKWPETKIKNYPVQGFGADLVKLGRIDYLRRLRRSGLLGQFISTIHDSLKSDCPGYNVHAIARMKYEAIEAIPRLCKEIYGYDFKLPLTSELQVGPNCRDMVELIDF